MAYPYSNNIHRFYKDQSVRHLLPIYNPYATIPVNSHLYKSTTKSSNQQLLPIVYRDEYNIYIENNLNVDNGYKKVIEKLKLNESVFSPNMPTNDDLRLVHTDDYLYRVKKDCNSFAEGSCGSETLNNAEWREQIYNKILNSIKYQTGGSILAGKLAMHHGWAINIGGGFHAASSKNNYNKKNYPLSSPFSTYADVTLLVHYILKSFLSRVQKVMIIDLDACQGHGLKDDFIDRTNVFVLDMYNKDCFSDDDDCYIFDDNIKNVAISIKEKVKEREETWNWRKMKKSIYKFIKFNGEYNNNNNNCGCSNDDVEEEEEEEEEEENDEKKKKKREKKKKEMFESFYLNLISVNIEQCLNNFCPDFVVYLSGTNILMNESQGGFGISKAGFLRRDEIVFEKVRRVRNIPIVMLMGHNYMNATVIADSMRYLNSKGLINYNNNVIT